MRNLEALSDTVWDYVIVGAGIMGAQLFRNLSQTGKKVLLLDKGDFGSGTSSNSGMLIWGGLLYLKHGDLKSIVKLSRARNQLVQSDPDNIEDFGVKYVRKHRSPHVNLGFSFYQWISHRKFNLLRSIKQYAEQAFLPSSYKFAYPTEEAHIKSSDARYVLDIIFSSQNQDAIAVNYLEICNGKFLTGEWALEVEDKILKQKLNLNCRYLVNCCGAGTELLNTKLGNCGSPYKHVSSKGVYLCLSNTYLAKDLLVFDLNSVNDVITMSPHRKTVLWGPTEDKISNLSEGFDITAEDIRWLAQRYEEIFEKKLKRQDVVSVRSGVRPLAVNASYSSDSHTLSISRDTHFYINQVQSVATVYGGKITGAFEVMKNLANKICPSQSRQVPIIKNEWKKNLTHRFNDQMVLNPRWAYEHEQCWNVEDFLRRRTFINQDVHNGGFGLKFEHAKNIEDLMINDTKSLPAHFYASYILYKKEQERIDSLLNEVIGE